MTVPQKRAYILLITLCCMHTAATFAQQRTRRYDTLQTDSWHFTRNKFINNIFQQAINSVKRTPDAGPGDSYLNGKSEDPYLPYQGKIVRSIYVETVNFDRSFKDTSLRDNSLGARIGNRFHRSTRKFVIRDNLFIEVGKPINAFMVADNERFIRSLGYIQDARIVLDTIPGQRDSVDVKVYTKDFFSIAGGAASDGFSRINAQLYDANLAGMGQRLEVSALYDNNRNPHTGYGALYRKNNVMHTFVDFTVGHSVINNSYYTQSEERQDYISLTRQLVSPYSRYAGAFTISQNQAYNPYGGPDSIVRRYKYNLLDAWAGYSIGIRQLTATNNTIRDRRFLAFRYYNRQFIQTPYQVGGSFDPVYNSSQAMLAQFTFYRQDYYKTQYIYGFGTTEDLPYGYNIAVVTGLHRQLGLQRPYGGVSATQYIATSKGDFIQLYLRAGGFLHLRKMQDAGFLVGATAYGRIMFLGSTKVRQYINASYTQQYNRLTTFPLRINNGFGPRGYLSAGPEGYQRISLQLETAFYLKYKFLGFQFAPFPYADLSVMTPEGGHFTQSQLYTSLGGGIRARNENLVFETIELRAYFFPAAAANMRGFKIIVNSNIRFRYSSNYVTAPELVQLN